MQIFDLLLLSFVMGALLGLMGARIAGILPDRGNLKRDANTASHASRSFGRDGFAGILAHHDGPVRLVPPVTALHHDNRSATHHRDEGTKS
jgi:hypothetical protein